MRHRRRSERARPRGSTRRLWNASTLNGNAARGNGVIHNQLYRGVLVWGRQTWSKSRETGTRTSRLAPAAERITTPVPQLRIVSEALWDAVQARHASVALGPQQRQPGAASRRANRLLTGRVRCGVCDGSMSVGGADARLVCSIRRERGPAACSNGRSVRSAEVEARVTAALRDLLLQPAVVEEALREFQAFIGQRRKEDRLSRSKQESELAEVKRRAARLVDQVADGLLGGAAVKERLDALEARRTALEQDLKEKTGQAELVLHPSAPQRFRALVEQLTSCWPKPTRRNVRPRVRRSGP